MFHPLSMDDDCSQLEMIKQQDYRMPHPASTRQHSWATKIRIECCVFAPPESYGHLATLAGLKRTPAASSSAEYLTTKSRDKSIRIWDARGTLIKTLIGHDIWVRGLVFHPGGKYLLSISDDKTLRRWDLSQKGKLVKTLNDAHGHFVSCIRWAPTVIKDLPMTNGENGATPNGVKKEEPKIRLCLATGSVDLNVRVFAG